MKSPSFSKKVSQSHAVRLSRRLTLLWHQARAAERAYRQALDELLPFGLLDATDLDTIYQVSHVHVPGVPIPTIAVHRRPIRGPWGEAPRVPLEDVIPLARAIYAHLDDDQEHFVILACNSASEVFAFKLIASGALGYVDLDPGVLFRHAQLLGARSVVLVHNHPSGNPEPSEEDVRLTIRLLTGGSVLNCEVLDHIVIGQHGPYLSIREHRPELWPRR